MLDNGWRHSFRAQYLKFKTSDVCRHSYPFANRFSDVFRRRLPTSHNTEYTAVNVQPFALYFAPTLNTIAHLLQRLVHALVRDPVTNQSPVPTGPPETYAMAPNVEASADGSPLPKCYNDDDIVISGMSGRFPHCDTFEEFERKLFDGVDILAEGQSRWPDGKKSLSGPSLSRPGDARALVCVATAVAVLSAFPEPIWADMV